MPACLFLSLLVPATAGSDEAFVLEATPPVSTDGTARLSWAVPEGARVLIQKAPFADGDAAEILYEGRDSATVVTGLPDGDYRFRGRLLSAQGPLTGHGPTSEGASDAGSYPGSDWSPVVTVRVQHHPLGRALAIFSVGALVFLGTAALIFMGARQEKKEA